MSIKDRTLKKKVHRCVEVGVHADQDDKTKITDEGHKVHPWEDQKDIQLQLFVI